MNDTSSLLREVSQRLFNKDRPDNTTGFAVMSTELSRHSKSSWTTNAIKSYMSKHKGFENGSLELSKACKKLLSESKSDVTPSTIVHRLGMEIPRAIMITKDPRQCICGIWFIPNMHNHKYCSMKCKRRARPK